MKNLLMIAIVVVTTINMAFARQVWDAQELDRFVGQPVDIASSAYSYFVNRPTDDNPPEAWLALKYYADIPINQPLNAEDAANHPAIKKAMFALLWEEIRPITQVRLIWPAGDAKFPAPEEMQLTTLLNRGSASSWWNNLYANPETITPDVSDDGKIWTFNLNTASCGLIGGLLNDKNAAEYAVPMIEVFTFDRWKAMDVEVEWGFEPTTLKNDYSGHLTTYDGRIATMAPLAEDRKTIVGDDGAWQSKESDAKRRGISFRLLYSGISKWRKEQPYTSQTEDVSRTIVTLWTNSGNISFLAADLENGPIYAPEYGFFIRRTSDISERDATNLPFAIPTPQKPLSVKMDSLVGSPEVVGWFAGTDTPWFGGNVTENDISPSGINFPAKTVAVHPGENVDIVVGWRSPIRGTVAVCANVKHAQTGGSGVVWYIAKENGETRTILDDGMTNGNGSQAIPTNKNAKALDTVDIEPGDVILLGVGPNVAHYCCTSLIEFVITETGGQKRVWNLTNDFLKSPQSGNPLPDAFGNAAVWEISTAKSSNLFRPFPKTPSEPPIDLASNATSGREYLVELQSRNLQTIRQQVREHEEQSWENVMTTLFNKTEFPEFPEPPAGFESPMKVQVPSKQLTSQWNLGYWHLVRHAEKHPENGRLWFNDFPYGILAAENFLIVAALDMMGGHKAAEDGLDQWVSLPMEHPSEGHHEWSLPGRPSGLFTEGYGSMSFAVGPPGWGGHMDAVHAFGPGCIGWALIEHYRWTGDKNWLKASTPRILANAEWMARQRKVNEQMVPGGERLWCKGLLPALQVTPDSGGTWMQFYECEAYYWVSIANLAEILQEIDPVTAAKLKAEAEDYAKDLKRAVDRSIALSPVVPVRDGTFHSVIPFACYVRGLGTGAWGWQRDGSGSHVGPLYWETVQSAAPLISPTGFLPIDDVRVQGYLDVLEDRLLLENPKLKMRINQENHFMAGWHYQGGLERTANMHLANDDVQPFLRTWLNLYAIDILPDSGYIFNEHTTQGPPDKIFEEAAFLERFRNLLVMEEGQNLWLTRAIPRAWLKQGERISVAHAPTYFGNVDYEIISDIENGHIKATVKMPTRKPAQEVLLRLRHPDNKPIRSLTINGQESKDFDPSREIVILRSQNGTMQNIDVKY